MPRTKKRRWPRRVALGLLALLLLPVLAVLALFTPPGRSALRDLVNHRLAAMYRGQLRVGRVDELHWNGPLVASGLTLRDPRGRLVADGGVLEVSSVRELVVGLWRGMRHRPDAFMPAVKLHVATLRLLPGEGAAPSIADAFAPRTPAPARTAPPPLGPPFLFRRLELTVDRLENSLGGFDATAAGLRADGGATTEPLALVVRSARTELTSARTGTLALRATFDWQSHYEYPPPAFEPRDVGTLRATLDLAGAGARCHLAYEKTGTREVAEASGCALDAAAVDRAAGSPVGVDVELSSARAEREGAGPWRVRAGGALNAQPFEVDATLDPADQSLVADATVRGLDLARIRPDLPPSEITGTVHVERRGEHWALDTTRLSARVRGAEVPGARAEADLHGRHLVVQELTAPALGLRARGEADLDHPLDGARGELTLRAPDAGRVPFAPADLHGALDLDAHFETRGGRVIAHATARARALRTGTARVDAAAATADLDAPNDAPRLAVQLRAEGVRAGDYGPLALTARAEGDPRRALAGSVHAEGVTQPPRGARTPPAPLRLDAPFQLALANGTTRVRVPNATVSLRGAAAAVTLDATLPREGAPAAQARLAAAGGGSAELTLAGHELHARFDHFSAAWLARAAATPFPLEGTLEGEMSLPARGRLGAAPPRGTLRWTDAVAPRLGRFDLALTTDRARDGTLALDATLALAPAPGTRAAPTRVHATARAEPPANATDAIAWLRGLRDARVDLDRADLERLSPLLPANVRLEGRATARLLAHRARDGAPLALTLALDARDARALRAPTAPLTVPLRLRGAACATLRGADLAHADLATDLALGAETRAPDAELPAACDAPGPEPHAPLVPEPLVQLRADLRGPWLDALTTAAAETRRALAAGTPPARLALSPAARARLRAAGVRARLDLGPLTTERWPLTPEGGTAFPALAPPRRPLEATLTLTAEGTLASPAVALDARARSWNVPGLTGQGEVMATATASLAPAAPNDFVLDRAALALDARAELRTHDGNAPATNAGTAAARVELLGHLQSLLDPRAALRALERRSVALDVTDVRLARLAWARARDIDGTLTLHARDSDDPGVLLTADLTARDLRVRDAPPAGATVSARVQSESGAFTLRACAGLDPAGNAPAACTPDAPPGAPPGSLRAFAVVPLAGALPALRPDLRAARVSLAAERVRLEPISALTEAIAQARVGGTLTARLDWSGAAPREARGEVHLANGVLDLASVGAPATDVTLDLSDDGRRVRLSRLSLRLGPGTLQGDGEADVNLAGADLARARLRLVADRMLIAQAGNNYGLLSTRADLTADARVDGLRAQLTLHDARLRMPQQPTHDVQALEPDPHVVVLGRTPAGGARGGGPAPGGYPMEIELVADEPVVVTRNDFYLVARPRIRARLDNAGTALSGGVNLALSQSWFEALGKRFYFDRAAVRFDGSVKPDPTLDIAAHYDSPTAGRINVLLSGRLSDPTIRFNAEQYPAADQSEVLAMLVLGRRDAEGPGDQQNVAGQATAAIAGLAAGFGVNLLTNAIGERSDFVPRLIVEPGGEGVGRYGLGVTEFSGRLYVEGTYGTAQGYGGAQGNAASQAGGTMQEFRGLIEYVLSRRWSVRGQYGTSNRFGLDVFWAPTR